MVMQSSLLIPFVDLPTGLRAAFFFSVRLLRFAFCLELTRRKRIRLENDLEMGYYFRGDNKEKPSLASLFADDNIAAKIASHLHYSDLVTISLTSKRMRGIMFHLGGPENRPELLAERSCEGDKGECWGCARVVCSVSASFFPMFFLILPRAAKTIYLRQRPAKLTKKKLQPPAQPGT